MPIHLCPSRLPSQHQPFPHLSPNPDTQTNRGQIIVIFAVTLLALIFFAGLAIDAGSLYVTYGQLRRAIDSGAVAAANDYKSEGAGNKIPPLARMKAAALEMMKLHNLDQTTVDLKLYVCDRNGDGARDTDLEAISPTFFHQCPDTNVGEDPRKMVWIEAKQKAPLYFLSMLGFQSVPLSANAVAEAAPIDLVIVIDTSESMANKTTGYSYPFNPYACNEAQNCEPLKSAKRAATGLIDTLYDGYDHVAIVQYDVTAKRYPTSGMYTDLAVAKADLADKNKMRVHDDPSGSLIWPDWRGSGPVVVDGITTMGLKFNPVYPEDRNGDGLDADPACTPDDLRMDGTTPCDAGNLFDSYDWNENGVYDAADNTFARNMLTAKGCNPDDLASCNPPAWTYFTPNSTCTGCGIRVGARILKDNGRSNSIWVMVFLSDGLVNLSDVSPDIPAGYPLGYCQGPIGSLMWSNDCIDSRKNWVQVTVDLNGDGDTNDWAESYKSFGTTRYCKEVAANCPPFSQSAKTQMSKYSVYDYALDQIDAAALQKSPNTNEAVVGSDIAIYAIGLGDAATPPPGTTKPIGAYLLRYMAAVGDDGDRTTNECDKINPNTGVVYGPLEACGQYYYTADGSGLNAIFNDISTRIYTRLTK